MGRRLVDERRQREWNVTLRKAIASAYSDQRRRMDRRIADHGVSLTASTTVPAWSDDEWAKAVDEVVRPVAGQVGVEVEQAAKFGLAAGATWGMPTKATAFATKVVSTVLSSGSRFGASLNAQVSALADLQDALGVTAAGGPKPAVSITARAAVEAANSIDAEEVKALLEAAGERDAAAGVAYKAERAREEAERVMRQAQTSIANALDDGPATFDSLSESLVNSFTQEISQDAVSYAAYLQGDVYSDATVTWNAVGDDSTRDAHMDADGQEVGLNEPFEVDGEALYYPGDPAGSDANTINCRCWLTYDGVDEDTGEAEREAE